MRRTSRILQISMFVWVVGTSAAYADPATPRHDRHQVLQARRIAAGVRSGDLTTREARFLHREQRQLRVHEALAERDGVVTARERARLRSEQCQASRDITRLRQNHRRRGN